MKLALGTAQFGMSYGVANQTGIVSENRIKEILDFAYKSNVDYIDTAISYGDSERRLGTCELGEFKIVTKIPQISSNEFNSDPDIVIRHIKESLSRLSIDKLHGVLVHDSKFENNDHNLKIWEQLSAAKRRGLVDKIGVSLYAPEQYHMLLKQGIKIDIVQIPYNLIDRRFESSGVMESMKSDSIEIHSRSVFLQGLLLLTKEKQTNLFPSYANIWKKLEDVTAGSLMAKVNLALSFACESKLIDKVVVGIDSLEQIRMLVETYNMRQSLQYPNIEIDDVMLINPSNWGKK